MQRHRPLSTFYTVRAADTNDRLDHLSLHENTSGFIRDVAYPATVRTSAHTLPRTRETTSSSSRTSSRDVLRHNVSSSHLECSPIPFYSEHSSSSVGVPSSTSSETVAAKTASMPRGFYDAPSMQDSIPVLLQQLTKPFPSSSTYQAHEAKGARQEQRRLHVKCNQRQPAVHSASPAQLLSTAVQEGRRSASATRKVPCSSVDTEKTTLASSNPVRVSCRVTSDARVQVQRVATPQKGRGEKHNLDKSGIEMTSDSRDRSVQHKDDRGGMRYVVVQQPAAVHAGAYVPGSIARLPADPQSYKTKRAYPSSASVEAGVAEPSVAPSPRGSSTTRSRQSTRCDTPASEKMDPPVSDSESAVGGASSSADGNAAETVTATSVGAVVPSVPHSSFPTHGAAVPESHEQGGSSTARISQTDSVSRRGTDSSSTHVSSTRMRNLFASLLDKTKTLDSGSHVSAVSTPASTSLNDSRGAAPRKQLTSAAPTAEHSSLSQPSNSLKHPHTIVSPLAVKPHLRTTVAGGVESRGASLAVSKPSAALFSSSAAAALAPFADAVMEGGDPVVLRHTIDYLLSKARRLEKENAHLWAQTHSWNPRRAIVPADVTLDVSPRLLTVPRVAEAAAVPRQPVRQSASTGTLRAPAVGAAAKSVAAATQATREASWHPPRIFVQRQRHTAASGRSDSPVAAASSPPPSPSTSSAASTPVTFYPDSVLVNGGEETHRDVCHTHLPAHQHSVTVSSPSAVADTTTTTHTRSEIAATAADTGSAAATAPPQWQKMEDSSLILTPQQHPLERHHRDVQTMQRAEAAVQHRCPSSDAATATNFPTQTLPPPPRLSRSSQMTGQADPGPVSPTAALPSPTAGSAQVQSLPSSTLRTPTQRSGMYGEMVVAASEIHEDGLATTPLASTVRSHRSMESRRSVASMTSHGKSMQASNLQAPPQQVSSGNSHPRTGGSSPSSALHPHQSRKPHTEERDCTTAAAASTSVSNASFASLGRPATYNKQVQTASILSPAEDESNGDATLIDSNLDGGVASMSTERTSIIELHTSAAYNRNTVRRLRAYCTSLETTRQQLRRRVATSPRSYSGSFVSAPASAIAGGGPRVLASSNRSSSQSAFPLPLAQPSATFGKATGAGAAPALSPALLSRPFFQSEYADPEVDATLHDVEETPAVETMIVLQEDGSGTVTKRVVDGSPSRVSVSAGRSPSTTSQQLQQLQQGNTMASSFASYHALDMDEGAYLPSSSSRVSPHSQRQPSFLTRANYRHGSQRAYAHSLFNISLRSDGNGGDAAVPNVCLGRSPRSESVILCPASERRETRLPDVAHFAQASIVSVPGDRVVRSKRFAIPSPTVPHAKDEWLSPQEQQRRQQLTSAAPLQSAVSQHPLPHTAEHRAATGMGSTSVTVETGLPLAPDPQGATTRASSTSSQRFAVPDDNATCAEAREARSCSAFADDDDGATSASVSAKPLSTTPPPSSVTPPAAAAAAVWNPKATAASPAASKASEQARWRDLSEKPVVITGVQSNLADGAETPLLAKPLLPPPPAVSSAAITTTATGSASSSLTYPEHDVDITTPKELIATSAAPSHDSACLSKFITRVSDGDALRLSRSRESNHNDPGSPLPLSPAGGQNTNTVIVSSSSGICMGKRSTTAEFLEEADGKGSPHQLVHARGVAASPLPYPPHAVDSDANEDDGDCADSFSGSEVDVADELLLTPEPLLIDRDTQSSDADRAHDTQTAHRRERLISPSPPQESSGCSPVHGGGSSGDVDVHEEGEMAENATLSESEMSSRWRRRALPPMQLPPIAPPRVTQIDEEGSLSTSLSRSLHSFSSSSSSLSDSGKEEDDNEECF
jgi:hypothetical protein